MSKPKSYNEPNGCWNCAHAWNKDNYEYTDLYCTKGLNEIPVEWLQSHLKKTDPRVVVLDKEETYTGDEKNFWVVDKWEKDQSVREYGVCDHWEEKQ